MSELNNIDRLFKEKFKDFEVTPSDKVWENIQSKMNPQEKETKLLPLWLRLCSFIAVFLIGFSVATTFIAGPFGLTNPFDRNTDNKQSLGEKPNSSGHRNENSIVTPGSFEKDGTKQDNNGVAQIDETEPKSVSEKNNIALNKNNKNVASAEHHSANRINKAKHTASETNGNTLQNGLATVSQTAGKNKVANASISVKSSESDIIAQSEKNGQTAKTAITQKSASESDEINTLFSGISETDEITDENTYDINHDPYVNSSKVAYEVGNKYIPNKAVETRKTAVTKPVLETKETTSLSVADNKPKSNYSMSNFNAKEITPMITDSSAAKQIRIAEGTEAKKETDKRDSEDTKEKNSKWIASTNIAPIYMNLNGSGSALDSKFDNSSKSYQTSMSYGVGLKYEWDKKWSVRTGLNALNFEYSTNNISYYYSSNGAGLQYVNENGRGTGVVIDNPNSSTKNIAYDENGIVTEQFSGNLSHKINYVEIPLEVTYKILDRKFGIEAIGGISSLLLNYNKVSLVTHDSSLAIGEANNLNKLHFSTNIGLGMRYSFMKNLHANVEPMLKYQINTYNDNAGNFKPYFVGIYSGISYSF
ncbi:outer membrane beta-barrel protein [Flavobacterium limnosediminis]|uniref:outer membrane beta-barrel protein n=1 Tax=Flavobacterium limnosediminis TaxID=1401027 RepID=UPI000407EDDF|nr:outer membrane beta-barrel protein [Flavobacterium limnosediminis]